MLVDQTGCALPEQERVSIVWNLISDHQSTIASLALTVVISIVK